MCVYVKENDSLTLFFLLPPFDTPTWQCRSAWQRKRNTDGFLITWFMFVILQRVAFPSENAGQFEREKQISFSHSTH